MKKKNRIYKKSKFKKPLISIITVVYNGEKSISRTIMSVINQIYDNIEYLIIDGGSKDKTLEIIKQFENKIDYWISEPDKGIYDAMNKGIKLSKGEIIYFLNSDDSLYDENVIKDIMDYFIKYNDLKILYGHITSINASCTKMYENMISLKNFKKLFHPPHPGTFMKKEIFKENGYFNINYKIAADFDLICECSLKNYKTKHTRRIISFFDNKGISSNRRKTYERKIEIIEKYFKKIPLANYSFQKRLILSIISLLVNLKIVRICYTLIFR